MGWGLDQGVCPLAQPVQNHTARPGRPPASSGCPVSRASGGAPDSWGVQTPSSPGPGKLELASKEGGRLEGDGALSRSLGSKELLLVFGRERQGFPERGRNVPRDTQQAGWVLGSALLPHCCLCCPPNTMAGGGRKAREGTPLCRARPHTGFGSQVGANGPALTTPGRPPTLACRPQAHRPRAFPEGAGWAQAVPSSPETPKVT